MANVGSLTVSLTALTGRFSKGMKSAAGSVTSFAKEVASATTKLVAMSAAGATVAATALAYLTHKSMESIDVTAKVADRLGATTEELLGMRYAADLAGVGTEEFDKAMEKLQKNLANPSKATLDALDQIGLSSIRLLNMKPAERFSAIADGINKLGTQGEKASVAIELFGKTGANLLNTMAGGSKGLAEARQELEKLAGTFNRVDAAKVEEANDSITKLKAIMEGVGNKLAIAVSPFVTELANQFLDLGSNGTSVADVISGGFVDMARSSLRLLDGVDLLKGAFDGILGTVYSLMAAWSKLQYYVTKGVAYTTDAVTSAATFGLAGSDLKSTNLDHLLADGAERDRLAVEAFARSREKFATAIEGVRSNNAKDAFDRIRNAATGRAQRSVADTAATNAAGKAAALKKGREELMRDWASIVKGGKAFGERVLVNGNGARLERDIITKVKDFVNSLPGRAIRAGYRMPIDLHTTARGTFSGESATRQTSVMSIQQKTLEQSKFQTMYLEAIARTLGSGVPIP